MIKKLKLRYIILALAALLALLSFIVAGMNLLNYKAVSDEADATLALLSGNQGVFPDLEDGDDWLPSGMSREIPFESRYFSVLFNKEGGLVYAEMSRIYLVDALSAVDYAEEALGKKQETGYIEGYRYIRASEKDGTRVTFLDCGRKLDLCREFAEFSIGISLLGYAVTAVLVCFFAGRFIRPVAESYEKQKRFITDAGHEIKTPLTIISADADMLRAYIDDNEYLDDIEKQVRRLSGLTNDLVSLARMEEAGNSYPMIDFPVSEIVLDASASFLTSAAAQSKELSLKVQPMLTMRGNDREIERLVSILLDNSLRYSPEGSTIGLTLEKQGRRIVLSVSNPSAIKISEESLRHVFDRFYRADSSRNTETGGHGIGLSMAQAIVNAHGGRIAASSADGMDFTVTASFPAA